MIIATVEVKGYGDKRFTEEIPFSDKEGYKRWRMYWQTHPKSDRLVHCWARSIRNKNITRVIKVEEEN